MGVLGLIVTGSCVLLVTESGNIALVGLWAGEMNLGPDWELEVHGVEKERWATSHGWNHVY